MTAEATLGPLEGVDSGGGTDRWPRRGSVGAVGAAGGMLRLFGRFGSPLAIQARTVSR